MTGNHATTDSEIDTDTATAGIESLNQRMNPEIKAMWVNALTSGEFKQGTTRMRQFLRSIYRSRKRNNQNDVKNQRFCCLGVLCELYRRETGKGKWELELSSGEFQFFDGRGMSSFALPTKAVLEWAGMAKDTVRLDEQDRKKYSIVGDSHDENQFFDLPAQNDIGRTFATIAKVIDKYL